MYIVAADGSGDYASIQAAVDAVPEGKRATIVVRAGEYRERVIVNRDRVRIVGEDRDRTVITHSACARDRDAEGKEKGTFLSFSMLITGHGVEIENLTVRNDAGDGRDAGQAVAVYAAGDRGVMRSCRLIAHQDTLFCGPVMPKVIREILPRTAGTAECVESVGDCPATRSRWYFENCFIQGDVDFIFGPYRCWFECCQLHMNARGGFYTAANTPGDQPFGFVFHDCRLTGECGPGQAYLGRPWRKYARTIFLKCEMDECVAPAGFSDWDAERTVTARYGEYASRGARADLTPRHPGEKRLTEAEGEGITAEMVLGGEDRWRPKERVPTWYLCGDSTMADYPASRAPMAGWGQALPALTEGAHVENCAVNGRSSKSFLDEMRLHCIEMCLRRWDRLVVSFSHNDEKADPLRHTDPDTAFPACLDRYIDAARRAGAEPILATPVPRRYFAEGRLIPTHGTYPDAMRALAKRRGVRLADLERRAMRAFQALGEEGTKKVFCHVPAGDRNYPDGLRDDSHLQWRGAALVARLFLEALEDPGTAEETPDAGAGPAPGELIAREDDVMK